MKAFTYLKTLVNSPQAAGQSELQTRIKNAGSGVLRMAEQSDVHPEQLEQVFKEVSQVCTEIQEQASGIEGRELLDAVAMREWSSLLAKVYQNKKQNDHAAQMLLLRAQLTNIFFDRQPWLVGDGMVSLASSAIKAGNKDLAHQCCGGVCADLAPMLDYLDDDNFPQPEVVVSLYWLQRAAKLMGELDPGHSQSKQLFTKVGTIRRDRKFPDFPSVIRLGPIAESFLDRKTYLAHTLARVMKYPEEQVNFKMLQNWGTGSNETAFYLSAIGSHLDVAPILAGVQTSYDQPHQEVFEALDHAKELGLV